MSAAPGDSAEILAVGSELLTPQRIDTNSLWLTERLNLLGVELVAKMVVGDDRRRLAGLFRAALDRSRIVILTGGLGPTEDDVTREAVALALGRELVYRQDLCDTIAARFQRMGRAMAEINKRQAWVIDGGEALDNPNGTAPGQWIEVEDGKMVMLLPGPPAELQPMFTSHCEPRLRARLPPLHLATAWFRVAGMGESDVDALIAPVYTAYTNPVTTILAAPGDVQIHLRARGRSESEARALVGELGSKIEALLVPRIYSRNGDPLEAAVGALLRERAETLAVAESCTGGLLGERLTSVPGSSDYFVGGFLVYSDAMKTTLLGVDPELIRRHTSVSEPVAAAMAGLVRQCTGATWGLAVTGYAGPDGGTEQDPVGTVYIGLAGAGASQVRRVRFLGGRERVRSLASTTALDWLRRKMG